MIFKRSADLFGNIYCLILFSSSKRLHRSTDIAKYIGISIEQYYTELWKFNSIDSGIGTMLFKSCEDIDNAVTYMNNKYKVILALLN